MIRTLAMMFLLVLSACVGLSPQECASADWHAIGYEDGAQGRRVDNFGGHRQACAKHGITADFAAYQFGHSQGVYAYCRPQNGYRLGARGHRYLGVCPADLEGDFLAAHSDGYGLYTLQANLRQLNRQLSRNKKRAAEIERLLVEKTTYLIGPDRPAAERATLAVELKQLAEEKGEVTASIRRLEREYATAEHEYEDYRSHSGHDYGG